MRACTRCGASFSTSPTGGRPRTRCDSCRSNHEKVDGTVWRQLRMTVLAEEPRCYVSGCGLPSTQVDHVIPLKFRPDLALERSNLRGICQSHNASKGARVSVSGATVPNRTGGRDADHPCACGYPQRHWCL